MNKKQKKSNKKLKYRSWIAYFESLYKAEQQKIAGYEQMSKIYSAYLYLLLKKLEATKDSMVTFKKDEIQEAIQSCAIRALPEEDGWSLYYEE